MSQKPVRLTAHAKNYQRLRGFSSQEVEEAIRTRPWTESEGGRLEVSKEFRFQGEWNGRVFSLKKVRPIFVDEGTEIVVITVYVYYY